MATTVRWSGEGRICWTSSPAGIRGKRRLGKDDFRRGATFLLCAHPAPERRPCGTQTVGEPKLLCPFQIMKRELKRVENGQLYLIPASEDTRGRATTGVARLWKQRLQSWLEATPRAAMAGS